MSPPLHAHEHDPIPVAVAEDWDALWQQMLRARAQPLSTPAAPTALQPCAKQGWRLGADCSPASAAWFQVYRPLLAARRAQAQTPSSPAWVLGQLGLSLDGCVATAAGDSYFVSGPHSLVHLHRLRALVDAVMVGAGTVAADDPQLTTRRVPGPQPVRVVLDPAARLDGSARVLRDAAAPTLWLCDRQHASAARQRVAGAAAEVVAVDGLLDAAGPSRGPDMARVIAALAARDLRLLLVEGGGVTVSRCLAGGVLDRLHLVIAPVLIGGGRRGLQFTGPQRMADCLRPRASRLALGDDVLWDLDLRQPARPSD